MTVRNNSVSSRQLRTITEIIERFFHFEIIGTKTKKKDVTR